MLHRTRGTDWESAKRGTLNEGRKQQRQHKTDGKGLEQPTDEGTKSMGGQAEGRLVAKEHKQTTNRWKDLMTVGDNGVDRRRS